MTATLIDGNSIARSLRADVATQVASLVAAGGPQPGLAVVLVGDDPASHVYVKSKARHTIEAGMASFEYRLDANVTETALLDLIAQLNADAKVHGILVQLPLPAHIDSQRILDAVEPRKDVDGFHPVNAGLLMTGGTGFVPCTPLGVIRLLESTGQPLSGLDAVVVGRSNIVGKPVGLLLLQRDCSVTFAHSRSRDLPRLCRQADILIAAVGRPGLIREDWIKPGAIVIDVGINRIQQDGASRITGDVAFNEAKTVAGYITPVPGGVGPMTIACLLSNTLLAARRIARESR